MWDSEFSLSTAQREGKGKANWKQWLASVIPLPSTQRPGAFKLGARLDRTARPCWKEENTDKCTYPKWTWGWPGGCPSNGQSGDSYRWDGLKGKFTKRRVISLQPAFPNTVIFNVKKKNILKIDMSNCQLYTLTANYKRWSIKRGQRVQKLKPLHLNFNLVSLSLYYVSYRIYQSTGMVEGVCGREMSPWLKET